MDASQNAEQVCASSSCDTKVDFHRQDAKLSSDFTQIVALSDSDVTDLQSQVQTSFNNGDDKAEIQAYILSVGTVKRNVVGVSKSIQSQVLHKRLLDESIKVIDGINCPSTLVDHHIEHEVLLQDGISQTQRWGSIHHFYVKVIGSERIAYGTAALLGTILNQDAIGIYHPITKDDRLILSSKRGHPLPDNFHPYFTVDSASPILHNTALKIIENVCERFPSLSRQLDTSGHSIEFHDFDLSFKGTSSQIEEVLKEYSQQMFQIKTHFAKSTLLSRNDYQQALDASGLEINR